MSFNEEVRGSGDFRAEFQRLKRRIQRLELTPEDRATLQGHVNKIRCQTDFARVYDYLDNLNAENALGPYDLVFEPDISEVKIYNNFSRIFGYGRKQDVTLQSVDYDIIDIGDSDTLIPPPVRGLYHYEPFRGFNGTSDFVSQAHSASLNLSEFSIAAWFFHDRDFSFSESMIVNKGGLGSDTGGENMNFGLWIGQTAGDLTGGFEEASGTDHFASYSKVDSSQSTWTHGAVTYDSTAVKLYQNGILVDTHTTTATPETNTKDLYIGRNSRDTNRYFQGMIDQVYVWNNDLTAAEILALYEDGTVPQSGNIVYSNTFGGSGPTQPTKRCYYAAPDGVENWDWRVAFHPPSVKYGDSISLNVGTNTNQFVYYDGFGTDFDFTAQNFSLGFWIYPTDLSNSGSNRLVAYYRVDSNNAWRIEIDDADNKLFGSFKLGGSETKRQYDTPLTADNWYYINLTWQFTTPTLSLKVNNNADTSSTKVPDTTATQNKLHFGSYPGATTAQDFKGYLAFPIYYKHSTVLTTAERTSLYNYNTKSNTTKPFVLGVAQLG